MAAATATTSASRGNGTAARPATRKAFRPTSSRGDPHPAADLLAREDDVREAITAAFADLNNQQPKRDAELARIDVEVRKADEALDRYFRAFENGTMPEQACAPRIADLTKRLSELQARRDELAADAGDTPEALNEDDLRALQAHVARVIDDGEPAARKALLQALVDEIRVASRDEIYPFFTLPTVRPPYGSVPPTGIEPVHAV